MSNHLKFYIDGAWVDPVVMKTTEVINPATEEAVAEIAMGSGADIDKAVAAARKAFPSYARATRQERLALLTRLLAIYDAGSDEMAGLMTIFDTGSSAVYFVGDPEDVAGNIKTYHDEAGLSALILAAWPLIDEAESVSRLLLPRLAEIAAR